MARMGVDDAETVIKQEQEEMRNAENMGLTTRQSAKTCEKMMIAIGDSLRDLACSDDEEDGDDDDADTELGKLSEDDEPGWVVGTLSKMVQLQRKR